MPVFAQQTRVFSIDATQTTSLKLSEIAEKVIAIPLSKDASMINAAFWTGDYLFLASLRNVWQYDAHGNFIRIIPCNGNFVSGVAGDTVKKELYIPVATSKGGSELWCYDFFGKLKKKVALKYPSVVSCLYHGNVLWILSEEFTDEKKCGFYSYVDISTGKETFLPQKYEIPLEILPSGGKVLTGFVGTLSMSDNCLYANWDDNVIWRIKNNKVEPAYKCNVTQAYLDQIYCLKGILGNYLFFHYHLNEDGSNMYLRHLKTGKIYNVNYHGAYGNYTKGAIEDVYNSGYFALLREPLNKEGYFWFVKNMRGKSLGNVPVKGNQVVFIVKMKQ